MSLRNETGLSLLTFKGTANTNVEGITAITDEVDRWTIFFVSEFPNALCLDIQEQLKIMNTIWIVS